MNLRSVAVLAVSGSMLALAAGCSTTEDSVDVSVDTDVETQTRLSSSSSGGSAKSFYGFEEPVCPPEFGPGGAPPAHPKWWYQVQATRVAWYLLGNSMNPFDPEVLGSGGLPLSPYGKAGMAAPNDNPTCGEARLCIENIRSTVMSGDTTVTHGALKGACGLPAGTFVLHISPQIPGDNYQQMGECAAKLDACWGWGVSGFFFPDSGQERLIYIDPEPVITGAGLAGSAGATAAATYVNSGAATTIVLFPDRWTGGSTLAAGTPCSPLAMRPTDKSDKIINVNASNQRKCM